MQLNDFKFNLFGTDWEVKFVDSISPDKEDGFSFGISDSTNHIIAIAKKLPNENDIPEREVKLSLLHELIHAILNEGQYHSYSEDEPMVEWIAKCLLSLQEQNKI